MAQSRIYNRAIGIDLGMLACRCGYMNHSDKLLKPLRLDGKRLDMQTIGFKPSDEGAYELGVSAITDLLAGNHGRAFWLASFLEKGDTGPSMGRLVRSLLVHVRQTAQNEFDAKYGSGMFTVDRAVITLPHRLAEGQLDKLKGWCDEAGFRHSGFMEATRAAALFTLWRHGHRAGRFLVAHLDMDLTLDEVTIHEGVINSSTIHMRPVLTRIMSELPGAAADGQDALDPGCYFPLRDTLAALPDCLPDVDSPPHPVDTNDPVRPILHGIAAVQRTIVLTIYGALAGGSYDGLLLSGDLWNLPVFSLLKKFHPMFDAHSPAARLLARPIHRSPELNPVLGASIAAAGMGLDITSGGLRLRVTQPAHGGASSRSIGGHLETEDGKPVDKARLKLKLGSGTILESPLVKGSFSFREVALEEGENKLGFFLEEGDLKAGFTRHLHYESDPAASMSRLIDGRSITRLEQLVAAMTDAGDDAGLPGFDLVAGWAGLPVAVPLYESDAAPAGRLLELRLPVRGDGRPQLLWLIVRREDTPVLRRVIEAPDGPGKLLVTCGLQADGRLEIKVEDETHRELGIFEAAATGKGNRGWLEEIVAALPAAPLDIKEKVINDLKDIPSSGAGLERCLGRLRDLLDESRRQSAAQLGERVTGMIRTIAGNANGDRAALLRDVQSIISDHEALAARLNEVLAAEALAMEPPAGASSQRGLLFMDRLVDLLATRPGDGDTEQAMAWSRETVEQGYHLYPEDPAGALALWLGVAHLAPALALAPSPAPALPLLPLEKPVDETRKADHGD
ncbi:hypothetical protein JW905_00340 [bacterium]|nr:hypothetical protein [candidate division CSSED10-310 bacterium]